MSMSLNRSFALLAVLLGGLALGVSASRAAAPLAKVEFARDVRPILSDTCFACHGPDAKSWKGGLRLDSRGGALKGGKSGKPAVVPGKLVESELWRRISTTDPDDHMPPADSGKKLAPAQVETLRKWISEGAEYKDHWAFQPVRRPDPPAGKQTRWPKNPIDSFVLARLEPLRRSPNPEAEKQTLIRRVTLDLTGLPPTPEEVHAFVADRSPDAYENLVDRLLKSPRYGERMAVDWLDAARYADTHGYHIDSARDMVAWRDWVIRAFNDNMPFDQFTIEQLAGDLLPNATREQKIASGFNRNNMVNYEGGAIPEEYLAAYIHDRINTTATVWMGLTMACAQCHDHKYDPISQRDYYRFYAFFNTIAENGLDGRNGNAVPILKLPTSAQEAELQRLTQSVKELEDRLEKPSTEAENAQAAWENGQSGDGGWRLAELTQVISESNANFEKLADGSYLANGPANEKDNYRITLRASSLNVTGLRLEVLPEEKLPSKGPGRGENGNFVLTDVRLSNGSPVPIQSATASHSQKGFPIGAAIDDKAETGWGILPEIGKTNAAVFALAKPCLDSSELQMTLSFHSKFGRHSLGRFRLSLTDQPEPKENSIPENIRLLLAVVPEKRTSAQASDLRRYYRETLWPDGRKIKEELAATRSARDKFEKGIPTAMVMAEQAKPRDSFILVRGQYDNKGEKVTPGVPGFLPELEAGESASRLSLAKWLVAPSHPLTARVTVNRYWQSHFGYGLVKTPENFGSQGDWPTNPELLDWLAAEFVSSGWDVKAMQRLMVTSATYRQSSATTRPLVDADPENQRLARGPRVRLHAEFIRDLALNISGLMDDRIGGESVYPYQPAGMWEELMFRQDNASFTAQVYVPSHGRDLYRRSLYTFIKRTSAHPELTTFDAPDRQVCTVRRPRTNTPLQALVLMNDPAYVEASRKLAERIWNAEKDDHRRLDLAFQLALGRAARRAESRVLLSLLKEQTGAFRASGQGAKLLAIGESPQPASGDPARLAAWTMVVATILNLDETITRN